MKQHYQWEISYYFTKEVAFFKFLNITCPYRWNEIWHIAGNHLRTTEKRHITAHHLRTTNFVRWSFWMLEHYYNRDWNHKTVKTFRIIRSSENRTWKLRKYYRWQNIYSLKRTIEVARLRSLSWDYSVEVTQLRLLTLGQSVEVTQLRSFSWGYSDEVTQLRLLS